MKNLVLLASVALFGLSMPAMADHHKGGVFAKKDADGNGAVAKAEYLENAEKKFMKIDADGNGEISMDEHKAYKEDWKEDHMKHGSNHDHGDHDHKDHHDADGNHDHGDNHGHSY